MMSTNPPPKGRTKSSIVMFPQFMPFFQSMPHSSNISLWIKTLGSFFYHYLLLINKTYYKWPLPLPFTYLNVSDTSLSWLRYTVETSLLPIYYFFFTEWHMQLEVRFSLRCLQNSPHRERGFVPPKVLAEWCMQRKLDSCDLPRITHAERESLMQLEVMKWHMWREDRH